MKGKGSGLHLWLATGLDLAIELLKSPRKAAISTPPSYVLVQLVGATLANGTLRLLFLDGNHDRFVETIPSGSDLQAFIVEFIITFYLMFVVCGVATDNRAIRELTCNWIDNFSQRDIFRADFGVIHESSKKLGVCNCVEQVQQCMDLSYSTGAWGYVWGMGIQLDQA
ncbi:Major intrinsic protein [Trema orientale]|uniref:Major intrinsic protein n=1 Tax=Trema orientale TaxID=63057 RepID=A0A2P5FDD5_TREOI|nr:Major intrinsic protein [Trema orientale]